MFSLLVKSDIFLLNPSLAMTILILISLVTFDHVDWTKLLEVLKNSGVNWRECQLICNLYMGQIVKLCLNQGETDCVEIGEVRQECSMSPIISNLHGDYLLKKALAEVDDFKIGRRITNKVRFAGDMAIIADTQEDLQNMDKQIY